ncbi:MAG TPA: hypothetical protein VIK30_03410 [Polyangia bacterium]
MGRAVGVIALAIATTGCRVEESAFEARIFTCDTSAKDPGCGVDQNGQPMVCYPASLLAGTDFCTASCGDVPMSLPDEDAVCVQGNAKLEYCDPSQPTDPNGCGQGLDCLRTDVTAQEGVCTTMTTCEVDSDCTDPVRSTCAATFLKQLYAGNTTLDADHLYCLQKNCQSGESFCSPGQSCLPLLVPAGAHAPDICVPNCDSHGRCPPNHFCYRTVSGPANPAICIPGLLGFPCATDIDCLVGKCQNDGDPDQTNGLNLCTLPCSRDADCSTFDSDQGMFVCVVDPASGNGRCEMPQAYRGTSCRADHGNDDCALNAGTVCVFQTPPTSPTDQGLCQRPCAPDGACPPRAGIGETCIPFVDSKGKSSPACYPGLFSLPCFSTPNCVGDLSCRGADPTTTPPTPGLCTTLCQTDTDCNNDRWTAGQSYCSISVGVGVCVPLLAGGKDCQADTQCQSKVCQPPAADTSGSSTCTEATP